MKTAVDPARWKRLSPLLDDLLDLAPEARATRLAQLADEDASLAADLEALLRDHEHAADSGFLEGRAASADETLAATGGEPGPDASIEGMRIGAYVLETPLGQGGTGAVWRARRADGRYEGAVAVKLLHLSLLGRTGALRFEREGAILARLSHPHIARLLDAGVAERGQPYLVLELVEGERIDTSCDRRRLAIGARVALFQDVLDAVAHAHRHLVIHRDLKPANILVTHDGTVKLLDFGIAKLMLDESGAGAATALTREGGRALTPWYAAPEQLRGDEVTTATDVYALGVVLYELLAGRHPTASSMATLAGAMRATLDDEPARLSGTTTVGARDEALLEQVAAARATSPRGLRRLLGGDLENIVAKALRRDPAERYPTVDAFAADLRRWAAGEPVSARAESWAYVASRFVARHRVAVAAVAVTLVAIASGVAGTITEARRAEAQRARAEREAAVARLERDKALEQQRLLRGTNEFLQLLMRDAAQGDPGAARRQLDRARALIEQTRFEHPIVKVALLRQTSGRYAELGELGTALQLLRQAVAATAGTELAAPGSAVPVNLACSLAHQLHEMGLQDEALVELERADALMAQGAELSVPSRVECRTIRAYVESALGRYERGVTLARDALAQLDAAGIREGEQRRVVRSVVAMTLMAAGRHADAMALARPLLEESERGQGRSSMAVLRRSQIVTALTARGGDPLAALALSQADRDDAARILGPGRADASFELEHGRILLALGRTAEASKVLERAATLAHAGHEAELARAAGLAAGEAQRRLGALRDAAPRAAALALIREAAAHAGSAEAIDALRLDAALAVAEGRVDAARASLDTAARALEAAGGLPLPLAAAVALDQGELMVATDPAAARRSAQRALAMAQAAALDPARSADVGRALLLEARAAAASGDADGARRLAREAHAQLVPTLGDAHPDARRAAGLAAG